jgi:DNA-binding LacI/PurR family transcriptional regulator
MAEIEERPEKGENPVVSVNKVTLRDVAEAVGVSISTVSRALAGAPGISGKVRDRIQSAAEKLNYQGAAQNTAQITLISDLHLAESSSGEFMLAVQRGIEKRARELGLSLSMKLVGPSSLAQLTTDDETSGYLLFSMQHEDLVQSIYDRGVPAVIVNGREPLMRLDSVAPANRTGGYLGAQHLIENGHSRILILSHSKRPTIRDRIAGSRKAMREAGLDTHEDLTIELDAMRSNLAYKAIKDRLGAGRPADFTAILCCNDECAFGAIAALNEVGLNVPDDVSVVGFDDIPTAAMNSVPLTTIHVEAEDIGERSVNRLIERIKSQDKLATYTETAVKLVERRSTAPVTAKV